MKPIKLIIKGLNSFSEQQTIDFSKLTERGLFGIFGPTGSGKSTILDGITLALYGKTSRNSSNFINTNCDEMSVTYEFLIRDAKAKHYIIDRTFKRNKDGGINAKKPTRIMQIVDGEPVILEESVTAVDKKCIDIIGLRFEDFIRTVVLPQGKFSEFLKLEGKARRDMLERLFNLDKYGNELSMKLGHVIKKTRSEMDKIEGQLKGYEAVNEETYSFKKNELDTLKVKETKAEEELKNVLKNYSESEKIWELKNELEDYKNVEIKLKNQSEQFENKKIKVQRGEDSLKVKPYIDSVNSTLQYIKKAEKNILENETLLNRLTSGKQQISEKFTAVAEKKDCEIPKLKVIENNVETAIEEDSIKKKLEREVEDIRQDYKEKLSQKNTEDQKTETLKLKISELTENISEGERKIELLAIDEDHRSGVQNGLILEEKLSIAYQRKNKLQKDLHNSIEKINALKGDIEKFNEVIKEKDTALSESNKKLEQMKSSFPGDADLLLSMQQDINRIETDATNGKAYEAEAERLTSEADGLRNKIQKNKGLKEKFFTEAEALRKVLEKNKEENLAVMLRSRLTEGKPCPVCGSLEYHIEKNVTADNGELIGAQEEELAAKEDKLKKLENEILKDQINLKNCEEKNLSIKNDLKELGTRWKNIDIENMKAAFNLKKTAIEKWTIDKEQLEKEIKTLNEQLNKDKIKYSQRESVLSETESAMKKYKSEYDEALSETDAHNLKLAALKEELTVENFSDRSKEIKAIDKQRENLEKALKASRTEVKQLEEKRDISKKKLEDLIGILATLKTQGEEKKKQAEEKEESIKNKIGKIDDLAAYKTRVVNKIKNIQAEFVKLEKEKNDIEEQYNKCDGELKAQRLELENAEARSEDEERKLQKALAGVGYKDTEEAAGFLITEEEIKEIKAEIEKYENDVLQLKAKIQQVIKKLAGKDITAEQWEQIKVVKENKEAELKEARKSAVKADTELNELKRKLEELKGILIEKGKLEHKLSLLDDLDSLFKGKKFVEFVAIHQLKYISLEASKRLKEITAGNYGLEVDETGKFIIRDYKNGGARRDASTLSGGETFLASLSLALALSAQIQLKGTAPLELFFLDEGFGTLDDNLLDVVMNSLEHIYSDRLSVGIISHVESIKNRVPIKLIVTPAEAGIGGSRVSIER